MTDTIKVIATVFGTVMFVVAVVQFVSLVDDITTDVKLKQNATRRYDSRHYRASF